MKQEMTLIAVGNGRYFVQHTRNIGWPNVGEYISDTDRKLPTMQTVDIQVHASQTLMVSEGVLEPRGS